MLNKPLNEFHRRNRFAYVFVVFMPVVMKGNGITIITVNSGSGNYRTTKISADIFDYNFRITFIRFGIDIEAFFMFCVAFGFLLFK